MTTDRAALREANERIVSAAELVVAEWYNDGIEPSSLAELRAALAAEPPALDEHKDDDPHHYELKCVVCGQLGTIRVSIDPESPIILDKTGRPTPSDLRGLAPGIAQGLSSDGYVRSIRDAAPPPLDVEALDRVVIELRDRGYSIPEASTIASTYHRAILAEPKP